MCYFCVRCLNCSKKFPQLLWVSQWINIYIKKLGYFVQAIVNCTTIVFRFFIFNVVVLFMFHYTRIMDPLPLCLLLASIAALGQSTYIGEPMELNRYPIEHIIGSATAMVTLGMLHMFSVALKEIEEIDIDLAKGGKIMEESGYNKLDDAVYDLAHSLGLVTMLNGMRIPQDNVMGILRDAKFTNFSIGGYRTELESFFKEFIEIYSYHTDPDVRIGLHGRKKLIKIPYFLRAVVPKIWLYPLGIIHKKLYIENPSVSGAEIFSRAMALLPAHKHVVYNREVMVVDGIKTDYYDSLFINTVHSTVDRIFDDLYSHVPEEELKSIEVLEDLYRLCISLSSQAWNVIPW